MADDSKKRRATKGGTVTRRINELRTVLSVSSDVKDIEEKITQVKDAMNALGDAQDEYVGFVWGSTDGGKAEHEAELWYRDYDRKSAQAVKDARRVISEMVERRPPVMTEEHVKLKKLEIPKFNSDPTKFYKWKDVFERFTKTCTAEMKYDYLLTCTTGEANRYVENKGSYNEAMERLMEKYGNVHTIIGLLIDDIRSLKVIRRGDFMAFEELNLKVNEFHDKLQLMGKTEDAENSYVLKEIERKFNSEDYHKWLESRGDNVDNRTVKELVTWLDKQTHIRRITHTNSYKMTSPPFMNTRNVMSTGSVGVKSGKVDDTNMVCLMCELPHRLTECLQFAQLPLRDKWDNVSKWKVCFVCLSDDGHRSWNCTEQPCEVCSGPHHKILHSYSKPSAPTLGAEIVNSTSCLKTLESRDRRRNLDRSFLPVVRVTICSGVNLVPSTAILDSGSEINIITPRCLRKLNLKGVDVTMDIVGAGGIVTNIRTKMVEVSIKSIHGDETVLECIVLDKACGKICPVDQSKFNEDEKSLLSSTGVYTKGGDVDILIGMSVPELHKQLSFTTMENGLALIKTKLGYCLAGAARNLDEVNSRAISCGSITVTQDENEKLLGHLQAELAGIEDRYRMKSDAEIEFEDKLKLRYNSESDGRFRVSLPWKMDPTTLPNNREQAVNRDVKLVKQLERQGIREIFDDQILEMKKVGILRRVGKNYPRRYLPLLAVVNMKKESTKVRVCLDAKSKYRGKSLNDVLCTGKVEMLDIMEMITQFRSGKYAIVGDIKKMFWQILLDEEDEVYHGIIYRGETYVFTRVGFGGTCSPNIADECVVSAAEAEKEVFPLGSKVLKEKRYMDDMTDASSSLTKIIQSRDETTRILGKFGFEIKEWQSNHKEVGKVDKNGKLLGLKWNAEQDTLHVEIKQPKCIRTFTRRTILKTIAELWDPLGFLCGIITVGKLILQSVVRMKIGWDTPVPDEELLHKWNAWIEEVQKCDNLVVPRSLMPTKEFKSPPNCSLIGFSDGSSVAYGCTLYLRWTNDDESVIDVKFVAAKGKLNPIRGTTVPRSEMCGAFTLSRLTYSAEAALKRTELNCEDKILFTDSYTVLSWIRSGAIKYKPYIKNKLIEVQELHPMESWRYIPGRNNRAADLISKGCNYEKLEEILKGPDILYDKSDTWTWNPDIINQKDIDVEKNAKQLVVAVSPVESVIDVNKFSSWKKLVRVTAYVLRFAELRRKEKSSKSEDAQLSAEEIKSAERYWILKAQSNIDEKTWKQAEKLAPFKDESGIFRIRGRLENMELFDEERKHPILLPKDHKISQLIVEEIHRTKCVHSGHLRVMAEVRKRYWILGLRQIAKRVGYKCIICRRWRARSMEQCMADLPKLRMSVGLPFENTAIDYFGPFESRYGGRGRKKSYGVIFTCLSTRAVHVDLASDLTTDRFLLALRRIISLYGTPKRIRSDNGKNFVGAAREITRMLKSWRRSHDIASPVLKFCESNLIEWSFSTPLASHHNGAVESMVKSVKSSLNKIVNGRVLWEEDYRTIFAEITACINSRPLWPASEGDVDCPPITCEDLLRPTGLPRDPAELNIMCDPRKRYHQIQTITNQWWKLWMQHFTPNLQPRGKWRKVRKNAAVDDLVLIIDPETPRSKWFMGVITNVYPGTDGLVRSVEVRTSAGTYRRPITKLCLLLSKEELKQSE